jgi:hypothetical protein
MNNNIQVTGMKEISLETLADAVTVLERGNSTRQTAETQLNEVSSRSHAIFTLTIETFLPAESSNSEDRYVYSKLHLVDLAGTVNHGYRLS